MRVATWNQSKWLTMSSCFFLFPAIYASQNGLHKYSGVLIATSLISANYWRKATYSWRRNADLIMSKIAFVIFVTNGIYYAVPTKNEWDSGSTVTTNMIIKLVGFCMVCYFYHKSYALFHLNNEHWVAHHFMFHCALTIEQYLILQSVMQRTSCDVY